MGPVSAALRFDRWPSSGLGLDAGSTTLKVVAVDGGSIVFDAYLRHRGDVHGAASALLAEARAATGLRELAVTGSAGRALASSIGGTFVHEVVAIAAATRAVTPSVRTVVELGGQDAKLLVLEQGGAVSTEWNERCAAGTGVVIDRIAHRLGFAPSELAELSVEPGPLPVVSSRCGVFAESDVIALIKAGTPRARAMAALFDAVVRQSLVSLGRGRSLEGPVFLLGGPHAFIPALAAAWRPHLEAHWGSRALAPGAVVVPADAQLFAALGAVSSLEAAARLEGALGRRGGRLRARPLEQAMARDAAPHGRASPDAGDGSFPHARDVCAVSGPHLNEPELNAPARLWTDAGAPSREGAPLAAHTIEAERNAPAWPQSDEIASRRGSLHAGGGRACPARWPQRIEAEPLAPAGLAAPVPNAACAGARAQPGPAAQPVGARWPADGLVEPHSVSAGARSDAVAAEARPRPGDAPGLDARADRARWPPGVFVGLDAGSTSVKAVALDAGGAVLAQAYARAGGNAFTDAAAVLSQLGLRLGSAEVRGLGITGYAAHLLGPVLGADVAVVETLAHARAARWFVPDAEVVCDVGGQDIKVLCLSGAEVRSFYLSQQCAAGNGALLESTAEALGVPLDRVARVTASARRAPRFSAGCAVFLDTERVTAQRDGWTAAEVLAGMTAVLPRNIWEHVVAAPSLAQLGDVFVLSGGVQRNAAAVRAQVEYLTERHPRARVVVHPWPGEAGAIGAAHFALDTARAGPSAFVGFAQLPRLDVSAQADEQTRCRRCPSRCARTLVSARLGEELQQVVTGNGCEVGGVLESAAVAKGARGVNLVRHEATRLFRRHRPVKVVSDVGRGWRVGLPRVLAQYRAAPLFSHYLEALGVPREHLVVSGLTTEASWRQHAGRGTAEACFPARVAQAHVAELLANRHRQPFELLFFPAVTHAVTSVTGCVDTASCPVVAGAPLLTRAAFEADADGWLREGVRLVAPTLVLSRRRELSAGLFEAMQAVAPSLDLATHEAALTEGIAGQRAWDEQLEALGTAALLEARRTGRCAVLVIGRPYHVDPGLQHELSSELAARGRTSLSLRALPHTPARLAQAGCASPYHLADVGHLTNSGDGERLAAARLAGAFPWLVAIELSSFKCGQDASLYAEVASAARGPYDKPFLTLHDLDETRPVSSLRLRLETFLDAVGRWEQRARAERW